ncbi:MAG: hypothetical protein OXU45_02495 [Candidatus Melainabacteria bacterium]|nr:hypothetical protein [Candidatus Melainabacteria bacterium]
MSSNRAAVLVQGVNSKPYIKEALIEGGLDLSIYEQIREPDTEAIFDQHSFASLGFWDWCGDVFQFYNNIKRRKAACRLVRKAVQELQGQGYEVDIIAHSLGCQIALTCAPQKEGRELKVKKTIFMGSPMGIIFIPMAWRVRSHAKKYSRNFVTEELEYLWSKNDLMCRSFGSKIIKVLDLVTKSPDDIKSESDHSVQKYCQDYLSLK